MKFLAFVSFITIIIFNSANAKEFLIIQGNQNQISALDLPSINKGAVNNSGWIITVRNKNTPIKNIYIILQLFEANCYTKKLNSNQFIAYDYKQNPIYTGNDKIVELGLSAPDTLNEKIVGILCGDIKQQKDAIISAQSWSQLADVIYSGEWPYKSSKQ